MNHSPPPTHTLPLALAVRCNSAPPPRPTALTTLTEVYQRASYLIVWLMLLWFAGQCIGLLVVLLEGSPPLLPISAVKALLSGVLKALVASGDAHCLRLLSVACRTHDNAVLDVRVRAGSRGLLMRTGVLAQLCNTPGRCGLLAALLAPSPPTPARACIFAPPAVCVQPVV